MKPAKVAIYVLILAALAAYVYIVEIRHKEQTLEAEKQANKILRLEKDKIVRIELLQGDQLKVRLQKPAKIWVLESPVKAKADEPAVDAFLTAISDAQQEKVVLEKDVKWEEYGLDKPEFTVVVATPDKKETLFFGASNPAHTSYYLRVNADPKVLLVSDTFKTALNKSDFDLRDKTIVRFAQDNVERIVAVKKGNEIELQRKDPTHWVMVKPESFAVKTTLVADAIRTLTNLQAKRIIDEPAKENDVYGLDNPEETIFLSGKNLEQDLLIGKPVETKDKPTANSDRYVRIKGEETVFVVDGAALKSVKTDPEELRDRSVLAFNPADIERIEISLDGKRFVAVRNKDKDWNLEEPIKQGPIDSWKITGLIWDFRDLNWRSLIKPIPEDTASVYLDKPKLEVALYKKDEKEPLRIKAGWKTEEPIKEMSAHNSGEKKDPSSYHSKKPATSETKDKKPDTESEKAKSGFPLLPGTVYAIGEPAVEPGAILELSGTFLARIRGELQRLTETETKQ